jgi:hypothetical protein
MSIRKLTLIVGSALLGLLLIVVIIFHIVPIGSDAYTTSGCVGDEAHNTIISFRVSKGQKQKFESIKHDSRLDKARTFSQSNCAVNLETHYLYLL